VIRKGSWDALPIFELIQARGRVPEPEMYQVFNMGIGMTLIAAPEKSEAILKFTRAQGQRAWVIGEVTQGRGKARIE